MDYTVALFLHIVGTTLLAAAFAVEWTCIRGLGKSRTKEQALHSLSPYASLRISGGVGSALILIPGIYMMIVEWQWTDWIIVSLVAFVVLMAIGGIVTGKRIRAIEKTLDTDADFSPATQSKAVDPLLWLSFRIRSTILLGIIYMMTAKPELWVSLCVFAVSVLLGLIPLKPRNQIASMQPADKS